MQVHIWIRKENEDWWKEHGSSAWVNEAIEGLHLSAPEQRMYDSIATARQEVKEGKVHTLDEVFPKFPEICKHGSAKGNCKKGC